MIPYDNIPYRDMFAYWGEGYILIGTDFYRLAAIDEDDMTCTLTVAPTLSSVQARKHVKLSQDEFFDAVLLHRPPLGCVVTPEDEVVYLSWCAAKGDRIKSILAKDIHCLPVPRVAPVRPNRAKQETTVQDALDTWCLELERYRANSLVYNKEITTIYPHPTLVMYEYKHRLNMFVDRNQQAQWQRDDALSLVRLYLTQPKLSFEEAMIKAKEDGIAIDANGLIVEHLPDEQGDQFAVSLATTRLGVATYDAGGRPLLKACHKAGDKKSAALSILFNKLVNASGGVL